MNFLPSLYFSSHKSGWYTFDNFLNWDLIISNVISLDLSIFNIFKHSSILELLKDEVAVFELGLKYSWYL